MALVSVELNIGLHPIGSLVGKLNLWLQAEKKREGWLNWISVAFPGTWLHAQLSPAAFRSPGKPWMSSSWELFSTQPQPSAAPWPSSSMVHAWQGNGKGLLEPGGLNLALVAIKDLGADDSNSADPFSMYIFLLCYVTLGLGQNPTPSSSLYSLWNIIRMGKDPLRSFSFP